ncbi:hypothetical protein BT96DRAFT_1088372 [Gymnopus androsaceus JB14]|uniref:Uncharacterized protein n=1 Tax=Gymnopus androsaceus JB14 TaxID=1447944 RepID=A0A6A4GKN5_9AGAR|nr:hypothetical protein BT96DRAFT_1088372 [Gymnopus androsaceus JB14]
MDADDESSGPSFRSKAPVDDISALLKQTLTDFLAEQANQPNNSSQGRKGKKQSSLKVGSVAYNRKVKKRGLAALSKEQEQKWRSLIRTCFCFVTNTNGVNAFQDYRPVDAGIVIAYENAKGPGPSVGEGTGYLLYFGDGWRQAQWNQTVVANLVSYITSQHISRNVEGYLATEAINAYVWELFQQARTSYRKDKPRLREEGDRIETQVEANHRARSYTNQRRRDNYSHSRKSCKFDKRMEGVAMILSQPNLSASDRRKWEKVEFALRELGAQGQSSEESDAESMEHQLNVTVPYFRRRILGPVFHELDEKSKELQKQQAKQTGQRSRSRPSIRRVRTQNRSERTVVHGLPRSFYHRRYIENLTPAVLQSLEINGGRAEESQSLDPWAKTLQTDSDTGDEQ